MKFKKRYILFALAGLYLTDQIAVYAADKLLLARDAEFKEHLSRANLPEDLSGWKDFNWPQCEFRYILYIYGYQTCFRQSRSRQSNREGYDFSYNHPRPKTALILRGDGPENYYFSESKGRGKILKHVGLDRKTEDVIYPNR